MERRLINAYDSMTMPDSCTRKIEQRLRQQEEAKKEGRYLKAIAPVHRQSRKGAAAALCLTVVCLSAMALFLHRTASVQTVEPTAASSTATETAPQAQSKEVPMEFAAVLSGGTAYFYGDKAPITLEEYCADLWGEVTVDSFTVADMDEDGCCEAIVAVEIAGEQEKAHLVLWIEDGKMRSCRFRPGELRELKKDGSFLHGVETCRLYFNDADSWVVEEIRDDSEKPPALWHTYPCQRADLVLRSYAYVTGTGWTRLPGNAYNSFASLALETSANDWERRVSYRYETMEQEGDTVYVFDPDAPGTTFYGTLTEENGFLQFSTVGCHVCTEEGEFQAEVWDILTDAPTYWVMTPTALAGEGYQAQGTAITQVDTAEEMLASFGYTAMPEEAVMAQTRELKALIDALAEAYRTGGSEAMQPYLAETYLHRTEKFFPEDASIMLMTYSNLPDRLLETGETLQTGSEIRLAGDDREYWFGLELVKERDGWKVAGYWLHISEE